MGYNKNNSKGMPKHGHHMVNSWEEEDVKRGKKQMAEGHKGHAEALFDDAHGSYNWKGGNHGSEPFHMQGSFMSKHAGNSYFHKQNLLDDMPIDDHAGGPLKQNEISVHPDRKNKKGQTQSEILENSLNKLNNQIDMHNQTQFTSQERLDASKRMIGDLEKDHTRKIDSINTANQKMDKHLQDVINKMNKGNYPGSLQK